MIKKIKKIFWKIELCIAIFLTAVMAIGWLIKEKIKDYFIKDEENDEYPM